MSLDQTRDPDQSPYLVFLDSLDRRLTINVFQYSNLVQDLPIQKESEDP